MVQSTCRLVKFLGRGTILCGRMNIYCQWCGQELLSYIVPLDQRPINIVIVRQTACGGATALEVVQWHLNTMTRLDSDLDKSRTSD